VFRERIAQLENTKTRIRHRIRDLDEQREELLKEFWMIEGAIMELRRMETEEKSKKEEEFRGSMG